MTAVTISPKFQVVIPKTVRSKLNIKAGTKCEVIDYNDHIILIPLKPLASLKGSLKGIDTTINREKDRL